MLNLLSYDVKNTARKIIGYIFGIFIFTGIVRFLWGDTFMAFFNNDNFYIADIIRWVALGVLLCLIALIIVFVMVRQTQWFDENLLSAQGQLTNMLPISSRQLVLSKILTAVIWSFIMLAVLLLVCVIFYAGTGRLGDVLSVVGNSGEYAVTGKALYFLIINVSVFAVVTMSTVVAQCFLSLLIGQIFSKLHNIIIFLSFLCISVIVIAAEVFVLSLFDGGAFAGIKSQTDVLNFCRTVSLHMAIMNLVMMVIYWTLSSRLLKNCLNIQ